MSEKSENKIKQAKEEFETAVRNMMADRRAGRIRLEVSVSSGGVHEVLIKTERKVTG